MFLSFFVWSIIHMSIKPSAEQTSAIQFNTNIKQTTI